MDSTAFPHLATIVEAIAREWPMHNGFVARRFANESNDALRFADRLSEMILHINPVDLPSLIAGYKWTCAQMMYEEAHFRKSGRYRQENYEQVRDAVYDNPDFMGRYLSGLLLSQLLWSNHFEAMRFFHDFFLTKLPSGSSVIEIGPGHGLLLALASSFPDIAKIVGVDISEQSIARTSHAMQSLDIKRVALHCEDMDVPSDELRGFDALICSEVLEHLENPVEKLAAWSQCVRPGGALYLNIPINSPAPDHISLFRDYRACLDAVEKAGVVVETMAQIPATGFSLADAIAKTATITCIIVGRKI